MTARGIITREQFLESIIWEFIDNEEHVLWCDRDGDGHETPFSIHWRCGCEEDSSNKWEGPKWSQETGDPEPTLDEVLHKWMNHLRYQKSII